MYIEKVQVKNVEGKHYIVNKETRGVRFGGDLAYFNCAICKNQVIGDESGSIYDCNNCGLIEDINKTRSGKYMYYCTRYVKEVENEK